MSRECTVEGLWLDFDERGCGVLEQELEMISMMVQDVSMHGYVLQGVHEERLTVFIDEIH